MVKHCVKYLLILCAFLLSACVNDPEPDDNRDSRIKRGDTVPAFTITLDNGTTFTSPGDFANAESTLLVFFNTSCPDCQEELDKIQQQLNEADAPRIICISRAEDATSVKKYWDEHSLTLTYAAVPDRSIYNLFAVQGIPRTYLVSKSGIVIATTSVSD